MNWPVNIHRCLEASDSQKVSTIVLNWTELYATMQWDFPSIQDFYLCTIFAIPAPNQWPQSHWLASKWMWSSHSPCLLFRVSCYYNLHLPWMHIANLQELLMALQQPAFEALVLPWTPQTPILRLTRWSWRVLSSCIPPIILPFCLPFCSHSVSKTYTNVKVKE